MRIGEIDDSVGKEFAARRETMADTVARLGEHLAEPVIPAARPAVSLADSVRISAEARAAQFGKAAKTLPLPRFPSPVELVAALKDIVAATEQGQTSAASERLGELVRRMAQSFTAPAAMAASKESDAVAGELVRALLGASRTAPQGPAVARNADAQQVARLVRQLLAVLPSMPQGEGPPLPSPTPFERAAAAILMAITRVRSGESGSPMTTIPHEMSGMPAALLALMAPPAPSKQRSEKRRPSPQRDGDVPDDECEPDSSQRPGGRPVADE